PAHLLTHIPTCFCSSHRSSARALTERAHSTASFSQPFVPYCISGGLEFELSDTDQGFGHHKLDRRPCEGFGPSAGRSRCRPQRLREGTHRRSRGLELEA